MQALKLRTRLFFNLWVLTEF